MKVNTGATTAATTSDGMSRSAVSNGRPFSVPVRVPQMIPGDHGIGETRAARRAAPAELDDRHVPPASVDQPLPVRVRPMVARLAPYPHSEAGGRHRTGGRKIAHALIAASGMTGQFILIHPAALITLRAITRGNALSRHGKAGVRSTALTDRP